MKLSITYTLLVLFAAHITLAQQLIVDENPIDVRSPLNLTIKHSFILEGVSDSINVDVYLNKGSSIAGFRKSLSPSVFNDTDWSKWLLSEYNEMNNENMDNQMESSTTKRSAQTGDRMIIMLVEKKKTLKVFSILLH